jgi:signal transduction histidine kinase
MLKEPGTENLIAQLFDNQPDSVVWFRPIFQNDKERDKVVDFEAQYANNAAAHILGVSRFDVIGTRLRSNPLMDEFSITLIFNQCLEVWTTGEPIEYTYYSPNFDRYFNVQRSKVEGGILSTTRDRTKEVKADIERQDQEKIYQQILDTSADGIMLLKSICNIDNSITDFRITHCNKKGLERAQLPQDAIGKTILELLPHLKNSDQFHLHKKVAEGGEPARFETSFRTPEGKEYGWFIVTLTKLGDGVISNFVDVSEKKKQEQQILRQKEFLNNILDSSLSAVYTCEAIRDDAGVIVDLRFIQVNQRFKELSVRPELDVIGKNLLEEFPATKQTITMDKLSGVIETGVPSRFEVHYHSEAYDGWYDTSAVKLGDNSVVVTYANITEQKKAALEIERQRELLDKLLRHSPSSISIIEAIRNDMGEVTDFRNILINDLAATFTGLSKEVLLTKTNVEIDPDFRESTAYKMLVSTLASGTPCFTDYQLPTGKWIEGAASKMDDDHLICITTDVTSAKETELQMKSLLEELKRSNDSLEEFTSAASHDLKEPIRKVHFFTEQLRQKLNGRLSPEEERLMNRVETATSRMQLLVDDLLEYSHVNRGELQLEEVNLSSKVRLILGDLELMVTEKGADVNVGQLPSVKGYRRQLQQLFQNIISNALKYNKPGISPIINIGSKIITGEGSGLNVDPEDKNKMFHLIEVQDNGIGFEQQYADRIFNIFTRLHGNSEYDGTGVGLAIVKKVVENHKGYIAAQSEPGKGATFHILLPA